MKYGYSICQSFGDIIISEFCVRPMRTSQKVLNWKKNHIYGDYYNVISRYDSFPGKPKSTGGIFVSGFYMRTLK